MKVAYGIKSRAFEKLQSSTNLKALISGLNARRATDVIRYRDDDCNSAFFL